VLERLAQALGWNSERLGNERADLELALASAHAWRDEAGLPGASPPAPPLALKPL